MSSAEQQTKKKILYMSERENVAKEQSVNIDSNGYRIKRESLNSCRFAGKQGTEKKNIHNITVTCYCNLKSCTVCTF